MWTPRMPGSRSRAYPPVDMSEQEIKEANTGTHVFIQLFVTPIDAMEDVAVDIYL